VTRTAAVVGAAAVVEHGHDRRDRREDRRDDRGIFRSTPLGACRDHVPPEAGMRG
jgi:hypothetical protein